MGALGHGHVPVLLLEGKLEGLLHFGSLVGLAHLLIGDDALEVDLSGDSVPGGHDVVQVDVLHERLHVGPLLDLLLAHLLGHLPGASLETGHQGVGVLPLLVPLFHTLHDHCLLASLSAVQEDAHSAVLEELDHY